MTNLSKREKSLLSVLIVALVFFLFYRFVYVPKATEIELIDSEIYQSESLHSELEKSIDSKSGLADSINSMKIKVREMDRLLPVRVYQEEVILYLEDLLDIYEIEATEISFSTDTLGNTSLVEVTPRDSVETMLYNYEQGKESTSLEDLKNIGNEDTEEETEEIGPEVERFEVSLSFSGDYTDIKDFMDKIESNNRLIGIHSVSMEYDNENRNDSISGSLSLSFPFYEDGNFNELIWEIESGYGKTELFGEAGSNSWVYGYTPDMTEFNRSDFYIFLDPVVNVLPTVTMGKTPYNYTAIYSDSNKVETINLLIEQDDSGIFYRYGNGNAVYPASKDTFEYFEPLNGNIFLNVYVRSEGMGTDIPGARLIVENETDKPLYIHVIGDNPDKPRFTYESAKDNVSEVRIP
jgi:type IV pilus assembly protein PilO